MLDAAGLAVVAAVSGGTVYWFYRARRDILARMKVVAEAAEEALKPRDSEYKWLGLYVGFHAHYKLSWGEAWLLYVVPPWYAPLYPPALLRRDRLEAAVKPRKPIVAEGHVALTKWGARSLARDLNREVNVGEPIGPLGGEATRLAEELARHARRVHRVSIGLRGAVHAAWEPRLDSTTDAIRVVASTARRLSG